MKQAIIVAASAAMFALALALAGLCRTSRPAIKRRAES